MIVPKGAAIPDGTVIDLPPTPALPSGSARGGERQLAHSLRDLAHSLRELLRAARDLA